MKRIGILLTIEPTWGGAFQYNLSILEALEALSKDSVSVVVGYSDTSWLPYLEQYKFGAVQVPLGRWGRFFSQLLRYGPMSIRVWRAISPLFHPTVKIIIQQKCDLWIFPSQDPWCYLIPVPAIATIHDLMHRYEKRFPEVGNFKEFSWREWHYQHTCTFASAILVDSNIGKQHVVESYSVDASKLHILSFMAPSYLSHGVFESIDLSEYAIPNKFLFYPAQFWEHKNHKTLLRAVSLLKNELPDIYLVCVGSSKNAYRAVCHLIKALELENNVSILGYVPNATITSLYRKARALVMPTFFGPTNIPPLEAMVTGCPVVVSNVYAMPEQTQGSALLFDPESVEDLIVAIRRIWVDDELCRTLTEKGLAVAEKWRQEDFNNKLISILNNTLSLSNHMGRLIQNDIDHNHL